MKSELRAALISRRVSLSLKKRIALDDRVGFISFMTGWPSNIDGFLLISGLLFWAQCDDNGGTVLTAAFGMGHACQKCPALVI